MKSLRGICRVATLVTIITVLFTLTAVYELTKPIPNGCDMTYMYPTFVPIPTPSDNVSNGRYGLFLYREGWKNIGFEEYRKKLNGVPVLFIPGNGGSYKQVRSLAKESDRVYQAGPPRRMLYQEAYPTPEEGVGMNMDGFTIPKQYTSMLDWFAVDLKGEHSAMDVRILEEHTQYVVHAIHRTLDQYKESHKAWAKEGVETSKSLPRTVILVGHSMGGFVARAATVHPDLRKGAVETILTLSTPHQSSPVALQPSLVHYYSHVNQEWRKGYQVQTTCGGLQVSEPTLSKVVVISVSGGIRDYQVRSKLESLDGIVPPTHGFTIGSSGMENVWLSTEHQVILWCNQLVVKVSHTLLSLIDSETGQPYASTHKRMHVFIKMLRSGIPQSFNWMRVHPFKVPKHDTKEVEETVAESQVQAFSPCSKGIDWSNDALEKNLNIQATTFSVFAMDGKKRWLNIQKLGSEGRNHFMFVTNLNPCSGVRLHLWPENSKIASEVSMDKRIVEVTSKMTHIPAGRTPGQTQPWSQTEQEPVSSLFWLGPEDMRGFEYLTITVAPSPTHSSRHPPVVSIGQFFNPEVAKREFSRRSLILSSYAQQDISLVEDHPLYLNLSFPISLSLLPVTFSVKALSCGMVASGIPVEETEDAELSKLCKLRCFPPVAIVWDSSSGVHIIPKFYNETIVVDSSPTFWNSKQGSEGTTVLLMVDPRCSYNISVASSVTTAAGRFMLLFYSQMVGYSFALIFFALARQTRASELNLPVPSMLTAVESNLIVLLSFPFLGVVPIMVSLVPFMLTSQTFPPFASCFTISIVSYAFSNGFVIIMTIITQVVFYMAANVHILFKTRWQIWEDIILFKFLCRVLNTLSTFFSLKKVRIFIYNATIVTALLAVIIVHPALGLFTLILSHTFHSHSALCSYFVASFPNDAQRKNMFASIKKSSDESRYSIYNTRSEHDEMLALEGNSQDNSNLEESYGDIELEIFNQCHGMLMLHFLAATMFVPSLVASLQRTGMLGQSFPEFVDVVICAGVILHALYGSKSGFSSFSFPLLSQEVGMSFVYLLAGCYCYLSSLAEAPFRVLYVTAAVGVISSALGFSHRRKDVQSSSKRMHLHRH